MRFKAIKCDICGKFINKDMEHSPQRWSTTHFNNRGQGIKFWGIDMEQNNENQKIDN